MTTSNSNTTTTTTTDATGAVTGTTSVIDTWESEIKTDWTKLMTWLTHLESVGKIAMYAGATWAMTHAASIIAAAKGLL